MVNTLFIVICAFKDSVTYTSYLIYLTLIACFILIPFLSIYISLSCWVLLLFFKVIVFWFCFFQLMYWLNLTCCYTALILYIIQHWQVLCLGRSDYNSSFFVIDQKKQCFCLGEHCCTVVIDFLWKFILALLSYNTCAGLYVRQILK